MKDAGRSTPFVPRLFALAAALLALACVGSIDRNSGANGAASGAGATGGTIPGSAPGTIPGSSPGTTPGTAPGTTPATPATPADPAAAGTLPLRRLTVREYNNT